MSELRDAVGRYLAELARQNASPHTIRNYSTDFEQFLEKHSTPPDAL